MKKNIVITAGGTSERIDSVRKITNSATGKLGTVIANTLINSNNDEIEKIYYICSKTALRPEPNEKIETIEIEDTKELKGTVENTLKTNKIDVFIHSMAVSDYTLDYVTTINLITEAFTSYQENCERQIEYYLNTFTNKWEAQIEYVFKKHPKTLDSTSKMSSYEDNLIIALKPTPKIISLIKEISPNTFLVGFKLLNNVSDNELYKVSHHLLEKNKCDIVIGNDLGKIKNGKHEAIFVDKNGIVNTAESKEEIAVKLTDILKKDVFNMHYVSEEKAYELYNEVKDLVLNKDNHTYKKEGITTYDDYCFYNELGYAEFDITQDKKIVMNFSRFHNSKNNEFNNLNFRPYLSAYISSIEDSKVEKLWELKVTPDKSEATEMNIPEFNVKTLVKQRRCRS